MTRRADDRGSVSCFVLLTAVALTVLFGLVAEGGQLMSARETAMADAEQAARTGAAQLSASTLHGGGILDATAAPAGAARYVLAADGYRGIASVSGTTVTATVLPFRVGTPLLGLVGISSVKVSARASASAVAG